MQKKQATSDLHHAKGDLEAKQNQLKALEARKTELFKALEKAKALPDEARQNVQVVLDRYVKGLSTEAELKAARQKISSAEGAYAETEELLNAVDRAITTTAREINKAAEALRGARKRLFSTLAADAARECREIIEDRAYTLIAAEYLARGGFDLDNPAFVVGSVLFNALFPERQGFSKPRFQEAVELLKTEEEEG